MSLDVFEAVARGNITPEAGAYILKARRVSWFDRMLCRVFGCKRAVLPRGIGALLMLPVSVESCTGCKRCGTLEVHGRRRT